MSSNLGCWYSNRCKLQRSRYTLHGTNVPKLLNCRSSRVRCRIRTFNATCSGRTDSADKLVGVGNQVWDERLAGPRPSRGGFAEVRRDDLRRMPTPTQYCRLQDQQHREDIEVTSHSILPVTHLSA